MKLISLKMHGVLDYVTVIVFLASPLIFGFSGLVAYVSFGLAVIHFAMTIASDFPLGYFKLIPMKLHKLVEAIVGPVLLILPWVLGFSGQTPSRYFFVIAGAIIILVGLTTEYFETGKGNGQAK